MRRSGPFVLSCALAWLAVSGVSGVSDAAAQSAESTDDELARNYFNLGTAQYERGDYEAALRSFEEAYRLSGRPGLLYNLYLSHERVGDLEAAERNLAMFLASGEQVPNREALRTRLELLRQRIAARSQEPLDPDDTEGPPARVGGAPAERSETRDPAAEDSGAGDDADVSGGPSTAGLLLLGVGGAGLASFATAAGLAFSEDRRLDSACAGGSCTASDTASLTRRNRTADVSLGVGAAAAVAGLLMVVLVDDDEAPVTTMVVPTFGAGRAGLALRGTF